MALSLKGKVALVTGGTRKIGKGIAIVLAKYGADVVVNGRNPEPAEVAMKEIGQHGVRTSFEQANLIRWEQVKQMVNNVIEKYGHLDIMALSGGAASSPPFAPFEQVEPRWYLRYAEAHWISKAYCIRAALDHMKERGYGKIISISTDAARIPTVGESMIGGGAAGLQVMTKVLARELGRYGIRINCIAISGTESPGEPVVEMTPEERWANPRLATSQGLLVTSPALARSQSRGALQSRQIFRPTSYDVGEAVAFLASEASDTITGQILSVNGGTWGLG